MDNVKICMFVVVALMLVLMPIHLEANRYEAREVRSGANIAPATRAWPKLFNFDVFRKIYHRVYKGPIETLKRRAIYMANSLRVYMHNTLWRRGDSRYYLKIGPYTDMSQQEMDQLGQAVSAEPKQTLKVNVKEREKRSPVVSDDDEINHIDDNDNYNDNDLHNEKLNVAKATTKNIDDDRMYHDWRDTLCFTPVKSQQTCGACWAFAGVAILEYEHCRQMGRLVSFSEQYYVDCSIHYSNDEYQLYGCHAGDSVSLYHLVNDFGVRLARQYPYMNQQGTCPSQTNEKTQKTRQLNELRPKIVNQTHHERVIDDIECLHHIDDYLDDGPIVVGIIMPTDFALYGGGVHTGDTCSFERGGHAMVAVGDGIEDGVEYWLFRNSFTSMWGDQGHFKLAKSAPANCHNVVIHWQVQFEEGARIQSSKDSVHPPED